MAPTTLSDHPFIDPADFHKAVKKCRQFFESKGWVEVHT